MSQLGVILARAPRKHLAEGAPARYVAILLLLAAAAIHVAVVPQHLEEWRAAGSSSWYSLWFRRCSQPACGCGHRLLAFVAIAVSAATVGLWVVSRTTGLPLGPEPGMPEPLGIPDSLSSLFEAVTVVLLVGWLAACRPEEDRCEN